MSIAKAQAAAIADGFLDSFGSSKADLRPKETFTEIILLAGELIQSCQGNLNRSNSNASGKLSESLIAGEPVLNGKVLHVDMLMNFYGRFVNAGVKGTRSGNSVAGYSFKNEIVSRKMLAAIKDWVDRGKINTRTVKKYKTLGAHEGKNRKLAKLSEADMSYAVARSIKIHGIKATGFLDKAMLSTRQKVASRLGVALKIDVINSLSNT